MVLVAAARAGVGCERSLSLHDRAVQLAEGLEDALRADDKEHLIGPLYTEVRKLNEAAEPSAKG